MSVSIARFRLMDSMGFARDLLPVLDRGLWRA